MRRAHVLVFATALLAGCASSPMTSVDLGATDGSPAADLWAHDRGATPDASPVACSYSEAASPGSDGLWGTADDPITGGQTATYAPSGQQLSFARVTPGPDGRVGTADDVTESLVQFTFDTAGRRAGSRTYNAPGADGRWGTGDDLQNQRESYSYDAQGRRADRTIFNKAGPDGVWGSADDVIGARHVYADFVPFLKDTESRIEIVYDDPGADGRWATPDDRVWMAFRKVPTTRAAGEWSLESRASSASGADGKWGTDDDPVRQRAVWQCEAKTRTMSVYRGPGTDGTWGTTDDEVQSRASLTTNGGCPFSLCAVKID